MLGFLGNSLSYSYGAMPTQVINLATANGNLLSASGNAPGGIALSDHAANALSLAVVSNTASNIVVLQQLSVGMVDADSLQTLGGAVTKHHGRVLLYETWGSSGGWKTDIPRLRKNYLAMATHVPGGAAISPVGLAWWRVLNDKPHIRLFEDDRHPTLAGAYLAACVHYASLFGRSPVGNRYMGKWQNETNIASVDSSTATYLQKVAEQTVLFNPWAKDPWGYGTNNFLWAYDWKNYSNFSGSTLPGIVISGGGGQPSPSVKVDTDDGEAAQVYLGVLDSANIVGQGGLYIFDNGKLRTHTLVVGKEGRAWVKQTGGTLTVNGTLTLGEKPGSYGAYSLSGSSTLDAGGGSIDIHNGILYLTGGTVRLRLLNADSKGVFADTSKSTLILGDDRSGVSVASGTMTINSQVSGAGGLTKTGAGTLIVSNTNSYSGETNINGGRLIVSGALQSSSTVVNNGAMLLGSGTVGSLQIVSGGSVSPGVSGGMLTAGNTVFQGGGNFVAQLANVTGTSGAGLSHLKICGSLDLSGLNKSHPFTIKVQPVSGLNAQKLLSELSGSTHHEWPVASFASLTGSFASDAFVVDTTGFGNAVKGAFSIGLDDKNRSLVLVYTSL